MATFLIAIFHRPLIVSTSGRPFTWWLDPWLVAGASPDPCNLPICQVGSVKLRKERTMWSQFQLNGQTIAPHHLLGILSAARKARAVGVQFSSKFTFFRIHLKLFTLQPPLGWGGTREFGDRATAFYSLLPLFAKPHTHPARLVAPVGGQEQKTELCKIVRNY